MTFLLKHNFIDKSLLTIPVRFSTSRSSNPPASDVMSPPSKWPTTSRLPNA